MKKESLVISDIFFGEEIIVSFPLNKIVDLVMFAALFALSILLILPKSNNLLNSPSCGVKIIFSLLRLLLRRSNSSLGFFETRLIHQHLVQNLFHFLSLL